MGFPSGWTQVEDPNPDEDQDSPRYHALGNAVTPPVVAALAKRIRAYLDKQAVWPVQKVA
jgi:DNA (cytosine-5)-methyltransferase 1